MGAPGVLGRAQWTSKQQNNAALPALQARFSAADFISACTERGWTVKRLSERTLRLTKNGSVLLCGTRKSGLIEALERIRDADAYARRWRRP